METYNGQVRTPQDAIILFEACRIGLLPRVQRRLSEKERQSIRSGSVFVWDEREAGMRRWTDGKSWSASRVSGSFLTYREMEGKRAPSSNLGASHKTADGSRASEDGDAEEGAGGYRYKPDGLMKQSFSITTSTGQHLHLISYFSRNNLNGEQPSRDNALRHIRPTKGLYPESTIGDDESVPPVTRSPMAGAPAYAMPPESPYNRPPPGPAPYGYPPYQNPHNPWGVPMPIPMNGYSQPPHPSDHHPPYAGYHPGRPGMPYPAAPPAFVGPTAPPNSMDQRPSRGDEALSPSLPPPPHRLPQIQGQPPHNPPQPHHPPSQVETRPDGGHQNTWYPAPNNRTSPPKDPTPPKVNEPPSTPTNHSNGLARGAPTPQTSNLDPLIATATAAPLPVTDPAATTPENPPNHQPTSASAPNATLAPASNLEARTASLSPAAPATTTPISSTGPGNGNSNEAPAADIPSAKLAFGEDKRALKALDKVFI